MSALPFRDPERGRALTARLQRVMDRAARPVTVMHVCGSHEQAIARYGLRERLPAGLTVHMGPGCPVCVTDAATVDAAVALARAGVPVLTWGDMVRVPGTGASLDDARAAGARVEVVTSATQVVERAAAADEPVVFFATGFETTAVATAAILRSGAPPNLAVLSAHKWVPAAMEVVAEVPGSAIEGWLAAGHAATITGYGVFDGFVARHRRPVVVAGFEPLDLLAALCVLVEHVVDGQAVVTNAFPRCVTRDGNRRALAALFEVFAVGDGDWRGIARVPGGDLHLRPAFAAHDARLRFADVLASAAGLAPLTLGEACVCGEIMTGRAVPTSCALFGTTCRPDRPVGACMVSTEGACRIWLEHGARR